MVRIKKKRLFEFSSLKKPLLMVLTGIFFPEKADDINSRFKRSCKTTAQVAIKTNKATVLMLTLLKKPNMFIDQIFIKHKITMR